MKKYFSKSILTSLALIIIGILSFAFVVDGAAKLLRVTRGGTGLGNIPEGSFLIGKDSTELLATSTMSMDSSGNVTIDNKLTVDTIEISSAVSGNLILDDNWISNDGDDEGINIIDSGNVGIATSVPVVKLDVAGVIRTTHNSTTTCSALTQGSIHFSATSTRFWGCNGTAWVVFD